MTQFFAGVPGAGELILILAIIILLFGARKVPDLAKGIGRGIGGFRKATKDITDEVDSVLDECRIWDRSRSNPVSTKSVSAQGNGTDSKDTALPVNNGSSCSPESSSSKTTS